jgi:hypothetical protein
MKMPQKKGEIRTIIPVAIALVILYILYATLIAPQFAVTYEYGFSTAPCQKDSNSCSLGDTNLNNGYCVTPTATIIACANCNSTVGYSTFLSSCSSLISAINGTHCYQCSDFGFKSVSTGLLLLILVIGMIFFAVSFMNAAKFNKFW